MREIDMAVKIGDDDDTIKIGDSISVAEVAEMQGSQNAPVRIAKKAEHGVPDVRRRSACHAVITSGSSHCLEGIR